MYGIDFHADDYAVSIGNSERILSLVRAGRIDSFSVITNMGCYQDCMRLLRESWDAFPAKPLLSFHLNLIDGYALSSSNPGAFNRHSWGEFFLHGFVPGPKRNGIRRALSLEIEAQLQAYLAATADLRDDGGQPLPLRIDSHVHTHMTSLVFNALMEALDRMNLRSRVTFIRCSTEPLMMFLTTPGVAGTISPVNIAKNLILHLLSHRIRRRLGKMGIGTGRIFGLAMTGEMDLKRVSLILPKMKEYAKRKDAYLEVLSHPGRVPPEEDAPEYGEEDRKALLSSRRDEEYRMLTELQRS